MLTQTIEKEVDISSKQLGDYLKELFIYFWFFSLLGHYLELVWIKVRFSNWKPIVPTISPLAAPYGLGVVMVIVFILPLIKKYKIKPLTVFILSTLGSAVVEYLSAVVIVFFDGYNKYWDYSQRPFNLNGYICLQNLLIFGILTSLFLYFIYPTCDNFFKKLSKHQFNIIFWTLFLTYSLDVIILGLRYFL